MSEDFYCEQVISGNITVDTIYETADILAFRHTKPFWEVHIVVIPKTHISSLLATGEYDDELFRKLFDVIRIVSRQMLHKYGGARILTNLGKYQESKHLHFHVTFGEKIRADNPV